MKPSSQDEQDEIDKRASLSLGLDGRKVFSAIGYNMLAYAPTQGLNFLRSVILARLLTPEAFGLFGIVLMTIDAFTAVSNLNLKSLIITLPFDQKDSKDIWLDSIWVMEILRSTLIFVAVWAASSFVGNYYGSPELYPLLVTAAFAVLIAGFTNGAFTLYERDIEYKRVVILELLTALVGFCTTIGLTLWRRDATVFVWGMVSANLFRVVMSFAWHNYRPSWRFDGAILRKCLTYGSFFLVISFFTYVTTQFDNLVIGKYMGLAALGIYLMAYKLAMMPVDVILQVVSRVMLPLYAKLYRENPGRSFDRWSTNIICLGWVFAMSSLVLWTGGGYWISLFYGQNWIPPMGAFYTLIGIGLFRGLAQSSGSMLLAMNRQDVDSIAKTVEAVIFVVLILSLVPRFGMISAGFAGLICYLLAFIFRTSFLLTVNSEMGLKLAAGLMRLILGIGIVILSNYLLAALSMPFMVRIALVPLLFFCTGIVLEPLLREYMHLTLKNTFLRKYTLIFADSNGK